MNKAQRYKRIKNRVGIFQMLVYLIVVCMMNVYLFSKYRLGQTDIKQISFATNFDQYDIVIYPTSTRSFGVDFSQPIHSKPQSDRFVFEFKDNIRNFRIDLGDSSTAGYIKDILVSYRTGTERLMLEDLRAEGIAQMKANVFSNRISAYFELNHDRITYWELIFAEFIILLLSIPGCMALIYVCRNHIMPYIPGRDFRPLFVALFVLLMFLPQPWFNIGFILSFACIVKDFSYRVFFRHTAGLFFLSYFVWFFLNNVLVNSTFNHRLLETMLPCLFLPFYVACLPEGRFLHFFSIAALLIALALLSTSAIDFVFSHNPDHFSFDGFAKYMHPVYLSYLFLFCIIYIELRQDKGFYKPVFIPLLGIALICCGSKLMLSLAILFYTVRFFRKKIYFGFAFIGVAICFTLLFAPTRKRFCEIINAESFSVLNEDPLPSSHDPRLTGLTLRLIIWQESLASFTNFDTVLFGHGTDQVADRYLENRLVKRKVEADHTKYDPHNQFITTLYKFGLLGLLLLSATCVYVLRIALKYKDRLLFYTAMIFIVAMCTESVLQRATGLYFFITIILFQTILITNTSYHLENSNSWNQRHS